MGAMHYKERPSKSLNEDLTRRQFVGALCSACGIALAVSSCMRREDSRSATAGEQTLKEDEGDKAAKVCGQERHQRMIVVRSKQYVATGKITVQEARRMLQRGISELCGDGSEKDGWRRFFEPDDVVGIKVNCLAGAKMSTHTELAYAIALELMSVGIKGKQVIIWDRSNRELESAGFKVAFSGEPLCFGTDTDGIGYEDEIYVVGNVGSQLSRIIARVCTALINVPVVKDHGIVGYTGALKNWLGAIHNPNKYHDDAGDPQIAELNSLAEIKGKQRLIICDALDVQYHGGPSFKPQFVVRHGAIIVSTDPVAVDVYCWKLIERYRSKRGLQSLEHEGRKPRYILTAGREPLNLGIADETKVQVIEIEV